MTDPVGLIGSAGSLPRELPMRASPNAGPGFKELLQEQIDQVNQLQNDARAAIEDLAAGRRNDIESVMIATVKADTAFRLLLQVRNKVLDMYEEIKQMRV